MSRLRGPVVAGFLIGTLLGGLVVSRCQISALRQFWSRGFDAQRILNKFNRELDLDAKQQAAVKDIIEKHHEKVLALHKETAAKFADIRMAMRADIAHQLNADQQRKFEAVVTKWEARHPNRLEAANGPETR